jgi:hypothetical protein
MKPSNQIPDEKWIKDGMQASAQDLNSSLKPDQQWFEEASTAIRQSKKFQHLIHK